jgi:hypothetical protein
MKLYRGRGHRKQKSKAMATIFAVWPADLSSGRWQPFEIQTGLGNHNDEYIDLSKKQHSQ